MRYPTAHASDGESMLTARKEPEDSSEVSRDHLEPFQCAISILSSNWPATQAFDGEVATIPVTVASAMNGADTADGLATEVTAARAEGKPSSAAAAARPTSSAENTTRRAIRTGCIR